jgi:sirohydrochlorin cobaltochelatase
VEAGALAPLAGPGSLLEVARTTASGAYRRLRASPDLRRGWRLEAASGADLWEALSALYPADALRWHQRREGALPVVPFPATAARQSGMYAGVGELRGGALDRAVGECCGGCLRTPVWAPAAPPAPGAETVPCPEACSLFVTFAREALARPGAPDRALSTTPRSAA